MQPSSWLYEQPQLKSYNSNLYCIVVSCHQRGLLDIVASASEFNNLPVRQQEEKALKMLAHHLPQKVCTARV